MPFVLQSRRRKLETLERLHPGATILDLTSRGPLPWRRFSPFYPHGAIPVPLSPGVHAMSVEGIWQGLKVFEHGDIDPTKLAVDTLRGIKRGGRSLGRVLGHRAGLTGTRLLSYLDARRLIYIPTYRWVLDNCLGAELCRLREMERATRDCGQQVVLLDYETNSDVEDLSRPLSHVSLVLSRLRGEDDA